MTYKDNLLALMQVHDIPLELIDGFPEEKISISQLQFYFRGSPIGRFGPTPTNWDVFLFVQDRARFEDGAPRQRLPLEELHPDAEVHFAERWESEKGKRSIIGLIAQGGLLEIKYKAGEPKARRA